MARNCPKCGDPLPPRAQACGSCDWSPPRDRSGNAPDPVCSHSAGSARCPLPAVWYDSTFATAGWCRLHMEAESRMSGAGGYEQLRHIIDNRRDYIEEFYPRENWREAMVRELIAANPDWTRGPEEGKSDYAGRMVKLCREKGTQVRQKMRADR